MKRKFKKKIKKEQQKKSLDPTLDSYFKNPNKKYNTISTKRSPSPLFKLLKSNGKKLCIVKNPSKTHLLEDSQKELKKYHNRAERTILCDNKIIDLLYDKLQNSFDKINIFLSNNKKIISNKINKKDILTKFLLQLKYTDISYISSAILSENFDEFKISQNLKNFIGYDNSKRISMNFMPNNLKECQLFWPDITEIISKYLNDFHEGKGLFIYVEHDYLSYLNKIKSLCNLYNYETKVIDETIQNKCMVLDKLSEAMQTKRLPSISDNLGTEILMLEEMVNSFSNKWEIFSKNWEQNKANNTSVNINSNSRQNDTSSLGNNISNISLNSSSSDITSTDKIKFTTRDISIINEEFELKRKESLSSEFKEQTKTIDTNKNDNNINKLDKIDSSTSEILLMNFKGARNSDNKINEIKTIEQNKLLLSKRDGKKSHDKPRDKSLSKFRNKSNDNKKRKNKKAENDINNTDIKGYFKENTKEHKIFSQLQNNIFLYCTKAKTAIVIADSFSDKDIDKRYFNNILLKISQSKCPIIVLTNNLDYLYNSQQKKIKNLNINCILTNKNKRDINIIYLYNIIIYLNIKLYSLKFEKKLKSYEQLLEYINNDINDTDVNSELCSINMKHIFLLSAFICYYGKFQIDVIDLRLTEIFNEVEREVNEKKLTSNNFDNIIDYICNIVFKDKNDIYDEDEEEKTIEELYSECEIKSFQDFNDGIKDHLIDKYYKKKLTLNDSYKNYLRSKDSRVNLEGLILEKYLNNKNIYKINNENKKVEDSILYKSFSFNDSINNKLINNIKKSDQLFISYSFKRFISISSIYNYVYPINRILIMKNNSFNFSRNPFEKLFYKISTDQLNFIDIHVFKKLFQKIENNYFSNKNIINYSGNSLLKKEIKQKKIKVSFY